MTSNAVFEAWLMEIAPKILLQKALLSSLPVEFATPPGRAASGLLSDLKMAPAGPYRYESAIAHQLAARHRQAAATLAAQLAPRLTAAWAEHSTEAIAAGLVAQATPEGWLTFTLAPVSVAAWLRQWLDYELPTDLPTPPVMPTAQGQWPLCDRLRLSLPMVLQWAYGRCHDWRHELSSLATAQPVVATPDDGWETVATSLLVTVMGSLDRLATRSGHPKTCQQEGYRLAQKIYDLEATKAQWQRQALHLEGPIAAVAAIAAAQKLLAMILTTRFGESPCLQL